MELKQVNAHTSEKMRWIMLMEPTPPCLVYMWAQVRKAFNGRASAGGKVFKSRVLVQDKTVSYFLCTRGMGFSQTTLKDNEGKETKMQWMYF